MEEGGGLSAVPPQRARLVSVSLGPESTILLFGRIGRANIQASCPPHTVIETRPEHAST